jgi:hypothetical protein
MTINAYKETRFLWWLGIFVWGDALVIGPFWLLICLLSFMMHSWNFFLLSVSLFWVVRSVGETIYWFQEQFATSHRNDPKNLFGYRLVKNDSIWFLYQITWQCITVLSLLSSLWFAKAWLQ